MSTPKHETIRRYAGSDDCVIWLHKRGIITDEERSELLERVRGQRDAAYERTYGVTP